MDMLTRDEQRTEVHLHLPRWYFRAGLLTNLAMQAQALDTLAEHGVTTVYGHASRQRGDDIDAAILSLVNVARLV